MRKRYSHPEKEALAKAGVYVDLFLTKGVKFQFAKLPNNDYTAVLLDGLKKGGFVSRDTKLCHFRVLFGMPLHESETPFEPIKWLKNKHLLHYFAKYLFGDKWYRFKDLFADRHGDPVKFPHPDKQRLISTDYDMLCELLNNYMLKDKEKELLKTQIMLYIYGFILSLFKSGLSKLKIYEIIEERYINCR